MAAWAEVGRHGALNCARPDTLFRVSPVTLDALVLDYGEVLVRAQPPGSVQRMAALARLDEEEFRLRYWRSRLDYDKGALSDLEYWRGVIDGPGIDDSERDAIADALAAADYDSWSDYREDVWALAAAFKRRGGRTAILSNGVPAVINRVRRDRPLADYFDVVVVSCEVGCTKPDPRIYELCLARLGARAEATLFVDDRIENLEGAARHGIRTLHFVGDESVEALRRAIGGRSGCSTARWFGCPDTRAPGRGRGFLPARGAVLKSGVAGLRLDVRDAPAFHSSSPARTAHASSERYRSGRNGGASKASCPKGHVGSNPTLSANKVRQLNRLVAGELDSVPPSPQRDKSRPFK